MVKARVSAIGEVEAEFGFVKVRAEVVVAVED